ncbi:hypothetical protein GOP47_0014046 [Adiantum capillus-veneris]|uniref:Uncharacterized protein n=1 Tax=Adiantum capillus-veneris TaxID=13818 RepID=A0A9D4UPY9_ADICA|nr:hypothetical protein GOP47_0014046 [Adiantum capillus-veneris]
MESGNACEGCGLECMTFDVGTGVFACEACGLVRQDTVLRHVDFDDEGSRVGTYVGGRGTVGSLGVGRQAWSFAPGSRIGFRSDHRKRYTIAKLDELASLLRLPKDKVDDVKHMLDIITEEKWGAHSWIDLLIATCIYIVSRKHSLPLSAAEIATTLNCPVKDILRVYQRVLDHMDMQSTPFDSAVYFDKIMSHHPAFVAMERDALRRSSRQGHCLLRYGVEWSLAAGRHPLALVAAVAVIIGKANNIKVDLNLVSRELHVNPATSRLRLKEYMTSLVGFAQLLPWGKDITLKTLSRHLPFLLQYLETRVKMDGGRQVAKTCGVASNPHENGVMEEVALRHIAKALYVKYGPKIRSVLENQPFDVVKDEDPGPLPDEAIAPVIKKQKVGSDTTECSSLKEAKLENQAIRGERAERMTKSDGKLETGEHRTWKPLPPCFMANGETTAKRSAKIEAAKRRIVTVKLEMASQLASEGNEEFIVRKALQLKDSQFSASMHVNDDAKAHDRALDDEDFLIQYCLIRGAHEDILKAGYYRLALSTPPVQPDREIMSDADLLKYFKTPREIEFLESLSEGDIPYPWLTIDELEAQSGLE